MEKKTTNETESISIQEAYKILYTDYPDIVTVAQMCSMLGGISRSTAYELINTNKIMRLKGTSNRAFIIPKLSIIKYVLTLGDDGNIAS
ncbi:MAG: DNA-binding protein [Oscillospiraceae bacterium]